ncbi:ABC transporter substrate-binding protein [Paraburkholderia sp.]|uniref:ABC transporter substrate-binding protein n=1 Tax=Paraburkholderia sp. TaxID=1926495 RepID=UPI0039E2DEF2
MNVFRCGLPGTGALLALCAALLFNASAHAQTPVPATLRIAIVPDYPPLEFKDPATNELTGFDHDLGVELAKRLGATPTWQETSFDQMISALETNRVDLILSAMTDLPERREHVTFVDYMKSGPQFYVQKVRAKEFGSLLALCGKQVGANRRSAWPDDVAAWSSANCVHANLPAVVVIGTNGSADARLQLRQGRLDAAVQGGETLDYLNDKDDHAYQTLGTPIHWRYNGIGIAKDNPALTKRVSDALTQMLADGTYARLLAHWNLQPFGIAKVGINGKE